MSKIFDWLFGRGTTTNTRRSDTTNRNSADHCNEDGRIPPHLRIRKTVTYTKYVIVENQAAAISATNDKTVLAVIGTKVKPKLLLLYCPCGCNELLRINLSAVTRPTWRIRFNKNNTISLYPSVDLDTGCRAHFILRDNNALVL